MQEQTDYKAIGLSRVNSIAMDMTKFVDLLIHHELSAREFIFVTSIAMEDYYNMYRFVIDVCNKVGTNNKPFHERVINVGGNPISMNREKFYESDLLSLEKRGWIKLTPDFKKYVAGDQRIALDDCFETTQKTIESFFVNAETAAKQIYELYPKWMEINGRRVSTLTMSLENFIVEYGRHIGAQSYLYEMSDKYKTSGIRVVGKARKNHKYGWAQNHARVVRGLKKFNELATTEEVSLMGIDKFIASRVYETVLDLDSHDVKPLIFS